MIIEPQPVNRWHTARSLIFRWLITTLAIFAAMQLVPGISFVGPGWELGLIAMIFGLMNLVVRPLLTLLTCPLVLLTMGLFGLMINAMMLWLTSQIAVSFGFRFEIDGFWPAFWGALVISIVTTVLNWLAGEGPQIRVISGPKPPNGGE